MINYNLNVTVPAKTTRDNYQESILTVVAGEIIEISVLLPFGVAGLAGFNLYVQSRQVFPLLNDTWVTGNDNLITIRTLIDLTTEPYQLTIHTYNDDELFEHTLYFLFTLNPSDKLLRAENKDIEFVNLINRMRRKLK